MLIGKSLGLLHKASNSFHSEKDRNFQLDFNHLLHEPYSIISPMIKNLFGEQQVHFLEQLIEEIITELEGKKLDFGFCHGDFHNFNMHINEGKLEIFDFDCCGYGYRAYDIAVFWWNLKSNYPQAEKNCWPAFFDGYLSQKSLLKEDINSFPFFITARRIWLVGTMLNNDEVWGRNWINQTNLTKFLLDLKNDKDNY